MPHRAPPALEPASTFAAHLISNLPGVQARQAGALVKEAIDHALPIARRNNCPRYLTQTTAGFLILAAPPDPHFQYLEVHPDGTTILCYQYRTHPIRILLVPATE